MSVSSFAEASNILSSSASSQRQREQAEQVIRLQFLHANPVGNSVSVLMEACASKLTELQTKLLALVTLRDVFLKRHDEVEVKSMLGHVINMLLGMLIINKDENISTSSTAFKRNLKKGRRSAL